MERILSGTCLAFTWEGPFLYSAWGLQVRQTLPFVDSGMKSMLRKLTPPLSHRNSIEVTNFMLFLLVRTPLRIFSAINSVSPDKTSTGLLKLQQVRIPHSPPSCACLTYSVARGTCWFLCLALPYEVSTTKVSLPCPTWASHFASFDIQHPHEETSPEKRIFTVIYFYLLN